VNETGSVDVRHAAIELGWEIKLDSHSVHPCVVGVEHIVSLSRKAGSEPSTSQTDSKSWHTRCNSLGEVVAIWNPLRLGVSLVTNVFIKTSLVSYGGELRNSDVSVECNLEVALNGAERPPCLIVPAEIGHSISLNPNHSYIVD